VLGNLLALAGMSAGPIFYDRIHGGDTFAGLAAAMHHAGFDHSFITNVQNALWRIYTTRALSAGSGISAFPSVHVATATMVAVYFAARSRWFVLPGILYVAAIQFMAVHTGYHYAIDGYFSIAVVLLVWKFLRRCPEEPDPAPRPSA